MQLCNHHLEPSQTIAIVLSYVFKSFFFVLSKKFLPSIITYNLLFPQLEDNIACDFLEHHHLQLAKPDSDCLRTFMFS